MAGKDAEAFPVTIHLLGGKEFPFVVERSMNVSAIHAYASQILKADEFNCVKLFQDMNELCINSAISQTGIHPGCVVQAILVVDTDKAAGCVSDFIIVKRTQFPQFKLPPPLPPSIHTPRTHALIAFQAVVSEGQHYELGIETKEEKAADVEHCLKALNVLTEMQCECQKTRQAVGELICLIGKITKNYFFRKDDLRLLIHCIPLCNGGRKKMVELAKCLVFAERRSKSSPSRWPMYHKLTECELLQALDFLKVACVDLAADIDPTIRLNKIDYGYFTSLNEIFEDMLCEFASTHSSAAVRASSVNAIFSLAGCKYRSQFAVIAKQDPEEIVRAACLFALDSLDHEEQRRVCPPLAGPPAARLAFEKPQVQVSTLAPVAIASTSAMPAPTQEIPETSEHDALLLEQAELQEALLKSKADARSADGVVIMRLTAHSPHIKHHLLGAEQLQACFDTVRCAGCGVCPGWANGAIMLVPITQEQVSEAGIELQAHNIVCISTDVALVEQALKQLPKRKSAQVKPEYNAYKEFQQSGDVTNLAARAGSEEPMHWNPSAAESPKMYSKSCAPLDLISDEEIMIEFQNTFLSVNVRRFELSESSTIVQSAPAASEQHVAHDKNHNPRRWKRN